MAEQWTYDGPDWIYLQPECDAPEEGRTWSADAINLPTEERQDQTEPTDCPYVRGDIHDAVVVERAKREEAIRTAHFLLESYCNNKFDAQYGSRILSKALHALTPEKPQGESSDG